MSELFPKSSRLLKSKEFIFVQRQGRKVQGAHVQFLVYRSSYKPQVRLGLTVSSKYGSSVCRNLFKRRNRELYRRQLKQIPSGWMIHIRPHGKVKHAKEVASYEALSHDWSRLLNQLQTWSEDKAHASSISQGNQDNGSSRTSKGT